MQLFIWSAAYFVMMNDGMLTGKLGSSARNGKMHSQLSLLYSLGM
jgi:hypothetical protein